jgi:hypothetical protein
LIGRGHWARGLGVQRCIRRRNVWRRDFCRLTRDRQRTPFAGHELRFGGNPWFRREPRWHRRLFGERLLQLLALRRLYILPTALNFGFSKLPGSLRLGMRNGSQILGRPDHVKLVSLDSGPVGSISLRLCCIVDLIGL